MISPVLALLQYIVIWHRELELLSNQYCAWYNNYYHKCEDIGYCFGISDSIHHLKSIRQVAGKCRWSEWNRHCRLISWDCKPYLPYISNQCRDYISQLDYNHLYRAWKLHWTESCGHPGYLLPGDHLALGNNLQLESKSNGWCQNSNRKTQTASNLLHIQDFLEYWTFILSIILFICGTILRRWKIMRWFWNWIDVVILKNNACAGNTFI